jgi:DNA-binding transcriptional LysR family regulator
MVPPLHVVVCAASPQSSPDVDTSNIRSTRQRYRLRMDLRQLTYIVAVVEERSISRAAARLNMSQPPLSTAIARMERELGVTLLVRHARGVEPTEAGSYLVDHARRVMSTLEELAAAVVAVGTGLRGRLVLAAAPGSSWELVPSSLSTFVLDRPDVDIDLAELPAADVVDRVRTQRADAGLVYATSARELERLGGRDLEVAMVRREPLVAVLPERLAGPALVDLSRLGSERWLLPGEGPGWPELPELVREAWQRADISPARRYTVSNLDAALHLVAAGFGVALMPASVGAVERRGVVVRRVSQPLPPLEWAVVWRRHERLSPVLARFLRAAMSTPEPDRLGPELSRSTVSAGAPAPSP